MNHPIEGVASRPATSSGLSQPPVTFTEFEAIDAIEAAAAARPSASPPQPHHSCQQHSDGHHLHASAQQQQQNASSRSRSFRTASSGGSSNNHAGGSSSRRRRRYGEDESGRESGRDRRRRHTSEKYRGDTSRARGEEEERRGDGAVNRSGSDRQRRRRRRTSSFHGGGDDGRGGDDSDFSGERERGRREGNSYRGRDGADGYRGRRSLREEEEEGTEEAPAAFEYSNSDAADRRRRRQSPTPTNEYRTSSRRRDRDNDRRRRRSERRDDSDGGAYEHTSASAQQPAARSSSRRTKKKRRHAEDDDDENDLLISSMSRAHGDGGRALPVYRDHNSDEDDVDDEDESDEDDTAGARQQKRQRRQQKRLQRRIAAEHAAKQAATTEMAALTATAGFFQQIHQQQPSGGTFNGGGGGGGGGGLFHVVGQSMGARRDVQKTNAEFEHYNQQQQQQGQQHHQNDGADGEYNGDGEGGVRGGGGGDRNHQQYAEQQQLNQAVGRPTRPDAANTTRKSAIIAKLRKFQRRLWRRAMAFLFYLHFSDAARERQFVVFNNQNDIEGTVAMVLTIGGSLFYFLNSYYEPQRWAFMFLMPLEGVVIAIRIGFIMYGRIRNAQLLRRIRAAGRDAILDAERPKTMTEALALATAAATTDPAAGGGAGGRRQRGVGGVVVPRAGETTQQAERRARRKRRQLEKESPSVAQLRRTAEATQYFVAMWNERLVYIFIALNNIVCFVSYPNIKYCVRANDPIRRRDCTDSFWIWPGVYAVMLLYLFVSLPRLMPLTWALVVSQTILFIAGRWLDTDRSHEDSNKVYAAQAILGSCICAVALTFLTKSEEMRREMFVALTRVERFRAQTLELQGRLARHAAAAVSQSLAKRLVANRGAACPLAVPNATVVAVRIAKFTEYCSRNSGREIAVHLRALFSACDRAVRMAGVHHIGTFGDLYVVVANMGAEADPPHHTCSTTSSSPHQQGGAGAAAAAAMMMMGASQSQLGASSSVVIDGQQRWGAKGGGLDSSLGGGGGSEDAAAAAERACVFASAVLTNRKETLRISIVSGPLSGVASSDPIVYQLFGATGGGGGSGSGSGGAPLIAPNEQAEVTLCTKTRKLLGADTLEEAIELIKLRDAEAAEEERGERDHWAVRGGDDVGDDDYSSEDGGDRDAETVVANITNAAGLRRRSVAAAGRGAAGGDAVSDARTAPPSRQRAGTAANGRGYLTRGGTTQYRGAFPRGGGAAATTAEGSNNGSSFFTKTKEWVRTIVGAGIGGSYLSAINGGLDFNAADGPTLPPFFGPTSGGGGYPSSSSSPPPKPLSAAEAEAERQALFTALSGERYYVYTDLQRRLADARASHFRTRWQLSLQFSDEEIEGCFVRDVGIRVASSSAVVAGSVFFCGLSLGCLVLLFLDIREYEFRPATTLSAAMFALSAYGSAFMFYCVRRLKIENGLMLYFALMLVWQCGLASSPPGMLTNNVQVWSMVLYLVAYMLLPPGVMTTWWWVLANGILVTLPMILMTTLLDTFAVASTIFYHVATLLFLAYMHLAQEYSTRGRFLDIIYSYFLAKGLQAETLVLHHQLQIPPQALALLQGDAAATTTTITIPKLDRDEIDPLNMYGHGGRLRILDLELNDPPPADQGIDETAIFVIQLLDARGAAAALGRRLKKEPSVVQSAFLLRLCYAVCDDAIKKHGEGAVFKAKQHNGLVVLATLRDNVPAVGHLARVVQDIYVRLHELRKDVVMTCTLAAGNVAAAIVGDDFMSFELYGDTLQTALRVVHAAPPGSLTCSSRFAFIYDCWLEEQLLVYDYYYQLELMGLLETAAAAHAANAAAAKKKKMKDDDPSEAVDDAANNHRTVFLTPSALPLANNVNNSKSDADGFGGGDRSPQHGDVMMTTPSPSPSAPPHHRYNSQHTAADRDGMLSTTAMGGANLSYQTPFQPSAAPQLHLPGSSVVGAGAASPNPHRILPPSRAHPHPHPQHLQQQPQAMYGDRSVSNIGGNHTVSQRAFNPMAASLSVGGGGGPNAAAAAAAERRKRDALAAAGESLSMAAAVQRRSSLVGKGGGGGGGLGSAAQSPSLQQQHLSAPNHNNGHLLGADMAGFSASGVGGIGGGSYAQRVLEMQRRQRGVLGGAGSMSAVPPPPTPQQQHQQQGTDAATAPHGSSNPPSGEYGAADVEEGGKEVEGVEGVAADADTEAATAAAADAGPYALITAEERQQLEEAAAAAAYGDFATPFEMHGPMPWKLRGRGVVAVRYVSVYSYDIKEPAH